VWREGRKGKNVSSSSCAMNFMNSCVLLWEASLLCQRVTDSLQARDLLVCVSNSSNLISLSSPQGDYTETER
jgi:hypothetical protein